MSFGGFSDEPTGYRFRRRQARLDGAVSAARRVRPGPIGRIGMTVDAIDVFSGFGGSSRGMHDAGATVVAAANHDPLSIECHGTNFPDTDHWLADLVDTDAATYVDPADLPRARFSWFSPSCTHHSPANAKKVYEQGLHLAVGDDPDWDEQAYVTSERSRVTMCCVLRYCERNRPEIVVVENVLEVTKWGPGKDGSTFRWWMAELAKLDYEIQCCFFNSMFFPPCPQSRDRLYVVAWRKGNRRPDLDYRPTAFCDSQRCGGRLVGAVQTWKRPTAAWMGMAQWGKYGGQYDYRCPDCGEVVHPASWMALSALDLSNLGPMLGERKRLPVPATMERIRQALKKYWWAPPVLLPSATEATAATVSTAHGASVSLAMSHSPQRYANNRSRGLAEQLPTMTQRNAEAVASLAGVLPLRSGRPRANAVSDTLSTFVADGSRQALLLAVKNNGSADEAGYRGHHLGGPLGALTVHPAQSLVASGMPSIGPEAATAGPPPQGRLFGGAGLASLTVPILRGDHPEDRSVGEATATFAAAGTHQALATVAFTKLNGGPGDTAWHGVHEPLNTFTSRDTHGLALLPWVDQWRSEPALITEQLATVTTRLRHALASIEPYEGPITDDVLMRVRLRMFEPDPEIRRGMAFPDGYILLGNKGQKTAGLGNAVTPPVSAWITGQCLATLKGSRCAA